MDFKIDAFPVDDSVGGIRSTEKIKIIICYILSSLGEGLSRTAVQSALYDNGIANYFEISRALEDLIRVSAIEENEKITLTEKGEKIARQLESELSVFIKLKAVKAARLTLLLERRRAENDVSIEKLGDKRCKLNITMRAGADGSSGELLTLSVFLSDEKQAQLMRDSFINNPSRLYEKIIEGLTGDALFTE